MVLLNKLFLIYMAFKMIFPCVVQWSILSRGIHFWLEILIYQTYWVQITIIYSSSV